MGKAQEEGEEREEQGGEKRGHRGKRQEVEETLLKTILVIAF